MIIAWASTENKLKFFRIERSFRTSLFVLKMTFKHLPPTQRNQATRRQPSCLAVDPGRCEFWRVQKNSAWGHRHLHNPPDIFPCNLIKLFTSLAPNYVDPAIHSLSITSLWALIVSNQPMSLFPLEWPTDAANKAWLCLTHKDFRQTTSFPPLVHFVWHFSLSWDFIYFWRTERTKRKRILSLKVHNLKTIGHYVQMMLSREVGCCSN